MLEYKAVPHGCRVVRVPRFYQVLKRAVNAAIRIKIQKILLFVHGIVRYAGIITIEMLMQPGIFWLKQKK